MGLSACGSSSPFGGSESRRTCFLRSLGRIRPKARNRWCKNFRRLESGKGLVRSAHPRHEHGDVAPPYPHHPEPQSEGLALLVEGRWPLARLPHRPGQHDRRVCQGAERADGGLPVSSGTSASSLSRPGAGCDDTNLPAGPPRRESGRHSSPAARANVAAERVGADGQAGAPRECPSFGVRDWVGVRVGLGAE